MKPERGSDQPKHIPVDTESITTLRSYASAMKGSLHVGIANETLTERVHHFGAKHILKNALENAQIEGEETVELYTTVADGLRDGNDVLIVPANQERDNRKRQHTVFVAGEEVEGKTLGHYEAELLIDGLFPRFSADSPISSEERYVENDETQREIQRALRENTPVIFVASPPEDISPASVIEKI
jgi:hypothetical protein